MHVIRSVGVLSCAKVVGAIQAAIGIVLMPFFLLAAVVGAFAESKTDQVSSLVFVVFSLFLPVFYGVFGFLMGAFGAWVYNLISKWIGGIELELQAPTATGTAISPSVGMD
ncbi:MAG TPA: hypothetical protein VEV41_09685 [Terriglobales bacterium]|jgi:hypothetical protein|nr:hypothetical protein [Terriglobales bacterium]